MNYYDRIYGQVQLDSILEEAIKLCPEIKRLRYVGMMNYRSLQMLGLTSISRLEHVIGTAYLAQVFAYANDLQYKNDLLLASLYHDVNCAPFGHAVEWAIDRHTSYKHEEQVDWMLNDADKSNISIPNFYGENGLHRFRFKDKFSLNMGFVNDLIQGKNTFLINNKGIDLDNIDNVYRMAHCLGILGGQGDYPILLAKNLRLIGGLDNFVIKDRFAHLVEHWHALRSSVYHKFIYSKEYFAYEGLLFKLMGEYVKTREAEDLAKLWTQTDDLFLSHLMNQRSQELHKVTLLARKLILFEFDEVNFLIKSDDYDVKNAIADDKVLSEIISESVIRYNEATMSNISPEGCYLHITTDNKKTARRVDIHLEDSSGNIKSECIGYDKQSLVAGFLSKSPLQKPVTMLAIVANLLKEKGLGVWKSVPFADEKAESYEQFGLF